MTNKERAKKIKKLIGFKRNKKILFSRPADIITDVMHYCDHYFDHESLDSKYDFESALYCGLDFIFLSDWSEVSDWPSWVKSNRINHKNSIQDLVG